MQGFRFSQKKKQEVSLVVVACLGLVINQEIPSQIMNTQINPLSQF